MFASCRRLAALIFLVASGLALVSASASAASATSTAQTSRASSARVAASLGEGEADVEGGFCLLQREAGSIHLRAGGAAAAAASSESGGLDAKADSKPKGEEADKTTLTEAKTIAAAEVSAIVEASDSSAAALASVVSAPASAADQAADSSSPEKTAEVKQHAAHEATEEPSTMQLEKTFSAAEEVAPAAAADSQKDTSAHASDPRVVVSKASDRANAEAEVPSAATKEGVEDAQPMLALVAEASPPRWMPLAAGLLDGSELHYAQESQLSPFSAIQLPPANATPAVVRKRSKVVLMLIDLCPVCWMTGIDRFYLGSVKLGIAKLAICISTCGLGGFIWGMIDFVAVLANAFGKEDSIDTLGMTAKFSSDQVPAAFWLAMLDILLIPLTLWMIRAGWEYRKTSRQAKLDEASKTSA